MRRLIELTGQRFGRWIVLQRSSVPPVGHNPMWDCRCDCGTLSAVDGYSLRSGGTLSCGCYFLEQVGRETFKTHGRTGSREYISWSQARGRCRNPKNAKYHRYGGRGITMCADWEKFEHFSRDMGACPKGHTLNRINNDGNYEPTNCEWATPTAQANNRHTNTLVTWQGKTKTIAEWDRSGIQPLGVIRSRLLKHWSVHRAFTQVKRRHPKDRVTP